MREIKFRIWDGIKLIHQDQINWIDLNNKCASVFDAYSEDGNKIIDIHNRLYQYTGLKDKNGVEIYEGDIVEFWHSGQIHRSEIFYVDLSGFWFEFKYEGYEYKFVVNDLKHKYRKTKVIGNIYENPELLERD